MKGSDILENSPILFTIPIGNFKFQFTMSILTQIVIILIALIVSIILTRNLKKVPDKKQAVLEMIVGGINGLVKDNMGEEYKPFGAYIGSLMLFLFMMNMTGLFGFKPPTEYYGITLGMALTSFIMIQANAIHKHGPLNYVKAYGKPVPFLAPLNIIERLTLPVSLSLRLFGNMFASGVIVGLLYSALGGIPLFHIVKGTSWIGQLFLPIVAHAYFDVFDGTVQMIIFSMLTMVNIKIIAEH